MTTLITDELSPYVVNGALPADMKATYYGLGLVLPQNLKLSKPEDFATWKSYGHHVRQFINSVEEKASKHDENSELLSDYRSLMAWAIGDFLVAGVKGGLKPRVLKRHVREILGNRKSLAWGTISNYMVTCKAIEFSRRRESLSFSHHVEVAKYPPEEQDRYLERAAAVRVSVREFKKMVHELQRQKMTMEERVAQAAKEKPLRLWIEVSEKERDQLREIARAKRMGGNAAKALRWMAVEYINEHKELLKAEIEANKALDETWEQEAKKRLEARLREHNSPEAVARRQAIEAERLKQVAERQEYVKAKLAEGKSLDEAVKMYLQERKARQESPSPVSA